MFSWIKRLLKQPEPETGPDLNDAAEEAWADEKEKRMESMLGPMHDKVMHALIPYAIGGGLDLYYYPNHIEGVGIATQELTHAGPTGSNNKTLDAYEIVMFTRHALDLDQAKDDTTPFGQAHMNINAVLNAMAPYSEQATLNPNATCEFPSDMDRIGGKCLLLDEYAKEPVGERSFGLMVVIEVFRQEMYHAREHGGAELIQKLKDAGAYPYSDLDRDAVV